MLVRQLEVDCTVSSIEVTLTQSIPTSDYLPSIVALPFIPNWTHISLTATAAAQISLYLAFDGESSILMSTMNVQGTESGSKSTNVSDSDPVEVVKKAILYRH